LKIHAAWAFGHVLRVAILEERTFHGSSMVRELLSLVLEDVMVECGRAGRPPPHTCVVVGDNTVKELKNSTNLIYAAQLVQNHCLKLLGLPMLVFLHFTRVYFFLNGMIVLIFLFFLLLIQQKTHRSKVHGDDDDEGFTYP